MNTGLAAMLALFGCVVATAAVADRKNVVVALIGDSTVTRNVGWGQAFADAFSDQVTVKNFAAGGRSSMSFYNEKRLDAAVALKPDYMFIQFGHNDQPGKGPDKETDPDSTYRDYLRIYINAARDIGAKPVLMSSVTRRYFDDKGQIKSWHLKRFAAAAREVAEEMDVMFIDLFKASVELHNQLGPEESMSFNPSASDKTHFNDKGARAIAGLVIRELKKVDDTLPRYLK